MRSIQRIAFIVLMVFAGCQHQVATTSLPDLDAIRLRLAVSDSEWSQILDLSTAFDGTSILDMRYVDGGMILVSLVRTQSDGSNSRLILMLSKEGDAWVVASEPEEERVVDGTKYYAPFEDFTGTKRSPGK